MSGHSKDYQEADFDELRRQLVLDSYGLLDTKAEQGYDDIVKLAVMLCATPAGMISLLDHERQWFKARVGITATQTDRRKAICDRAICAPDQLLQVTDVSRHPEFVHFELHIDAGPVRFYAGMPLSSPDGHPLGTLCVMDVVPRTLTPSQQEGLEVLARQTQHLFELRRYAREQTRLLAERESIAQNLEASKADLQKRHDQLKHSAAHDPLTGLLNRAALAQLRQNPEALARLNAAPYTLMLIDVDNFKQVNDRHGHLLGDRALRAVADAVAASIREGDVAIRYGGEEVLVVLPGTRMAGAAEVAERIRLRVTQSPLPFSLSVSIGLACGEPGGGEPLGGEPGGDKPERVFERADQALYRAKAGGRNRVVADDTPR